MLKILKTIFVWSFGELDEKWNIKSDLCSSAGTQMARGYSNVERKLKMLSVVCIC